MSLASELHRHRRRRGLSQAQLAAQLGVAQQSVSRWENGTTAPRADSLARIAAALDLPPAVLAAAAGYPTPPTAATGPDVGALDEVALWDLLDQLTGELRRRHGPPHR